MDAFAAVLNKRSLRDLVLASRSSSLSELRNGTSFEEYALSVGSGGRPPVGIVRGLGMLLSSPSSSLRNMLLPLLERWMELPAPFRGEARVAFGLNDWLNFLFSFSFLSALKNSSRGDCGGSGAAAGDATSDSGDDCGSFGGDPLASRLCTEGGCATFGTDLLKNFGRGSDDGAGELENRAPAYAGSKLFAGVSGCSPAPTDTGLFLCACGC